MMRHRSLAMLHELPKRNAYIVPRKLTVLCQILLFPFFRIVAWVFLKSPVKIDIQKLDQSLGYIIAANHQSMLDPIIITGSLPWSIYSSISPVYFVTANGYLRVPLLNLLLLAFGCFPAKLHKRFGSGLDQATFLLEEKANIWIFPEGQRTPKGLIPPRRGVSVLANVKNAHLVPVHINWTVKSRFRRSAEIHIGTPYNAAGLAPEEIMRSIYALPLNT